MAINIHHTYSTHADVFYYDNSTLNLREYVCDNMDDIAEHVCEVLIRHNFTTADVCDSETGEVLMVVERT